MFKIGDKVKSELWDLEGEVKAVRPCNDPVCVGRGDTQTLCLDLDKPLWWHSGSFVLIP